MAPPAVVRYIHSLKEVVGIPILVGRTRLMVEEEYNMMMGRLE